MRARLPRLLVPLLALALGQVVPVVQVLFLVLVLLGVSVGSVCLAGLEGRVQLVLADSVGLVERLAGMAGVVRLMVHSAAWRMSIEAIEAIASQCKLALAHRHEPIFLHSV